MLLIGKNGVEKAKQLYGETIENNLINAKKATENNPTQSNIDEMVHTSHENIHFDFINNIYNGYHYHDYFELIYAIDGDVIEVFENETVILQKGDALIIPPSVSHSFEKIGDGPCVSFAIRKQWLMQKAEEFEAYDSENYLTKLVSSGKHIFFEKDKDENFENIIRHLIDIHRSVYRNASLYNNLNFEYHFATALVTLSTKAYKFSESLGEASEFNSRVSQIIEYIVENYNTTNIDDIAEHFGYSKAQIHRIVKANTGRTISKHITGEQMKHAKLLLLNSNLSINAIANEVGFENPDCFAKMFKRERGLTPNQYRKNHPHVGNRLSIKK